MPDIPQGLGRDGGDVDFGGRRAKGLHQAPGVCAGAGRGSKAWHGIGQHIAARQAETVHRLGADDERVRRVEAAGDPQHDLLHPRGRKARHQPLDLDVVGLIAVLIEAHGIGRDEGEALQRAPEADIALGGIGGGSGVVGVTTSMAKEWAKNGIDNVFVIGDAEAPRIIADATFAGLRLAREIEDESPQHQKPFKREQKVWGVAYNPGENPELEWRL